MRLGVRSVTFVVVVGLAALALAPSRAAAQRPYGAGSPVHFDVHASVPGWYGAAGVGARVDITLTPQGVIENIADELTLSLGADLLWFWWADTNGFGVMPAALLQWNFWIAPEWSIFPELGVGFIFGAGDFNARFYPQYVGPAGGFGVRWHFSPDAALLMRVTWPAGLQVGIAF